MSSTRERKHRARRGPSPAPERRQGPMPREARIAAVVIIATMIVWTTVSLAGGALGVPYRYAFLVDFAALAAFFWALVVLLQVWRTQRAGRKG